MFLKNYYIRNKNKLLVYGALLLVLIVIVTISRLIMPVRVFLLPVLAILCGIGIVGLVKTILPIKNVLSFLVLSFLFGMFLNTFVIFVFGTLGFSLTPSFYFIYLVVVIVFNLFAYLFSVEENQVIKYLKNFKLQKVDIIWFLILVLFSIIFFNISFEHYFLGWDAFSFWAVDAKYIFQNYAFRDDGFDILVGHYYSFYPLQISYVYMLFGAVVEQYASMITLFYTLSSVFLLFSYVVDLKKGGFLKSFFYFLSWSSLYIWFTIHHVIFTQYSDMFCSSMVLLFGLILFYQKGNMKNYIKRTMLLILIALSFYLTKLGYSVITVFLLLGMLAYDFRYIFVNIFKKNKMVVGLLAFISLVGAVGVFLSGSVIDLGIIEYAFQNFSGSKTERFYYVLRMAEFLFSQLYLFLIPAISLFLFSFLREGKFNKKNLKNIVFVSVLTMIPLSFFIIKLETFADYSILRYFGLIYFLLPYLLLLLPTEVEMKNARQEVVAIGLTMTLPVLIGLSMIVHWQVDFKFEPHSGSYNEQSSLKLYYDASERVRGFVPEDSKILFVDEEFERLGNSRVPSMYLRYFLSEYSVGRQYITNVETWYPFMLEVDPDYVLVLEYDGYWESCNDILEEGAIQLIEIREGHKDYSETECFFEAEDVTVVFP